MSEPVLIIDNPAPMVRRFTLNRPDKRNALNDDIRGALFDALRQGDRDRSVSVMIIRSAGSCFCAGYDLGLPNSDVERAISRADGWWSRHVVNNWFEMWDMSTPIIGQVHGYCLAGGTELATACDLVYVADDAKIGYPPVRLMSPPDMQWQTWMMGLRRGMEALLTGDSMSGTEAVAAGFANRAYPEADLDTAVLAIAERVAKIVSQSGSARMAALLGVAIVTLFVIVYAFYDQGLPGAVGSSRLEAAREEQYLETVKRGYNLYEANCARCHGA